VLSSLTVVFSIGNFYQSNSTFLVRKEKNAAIDVKISGVARAIAVFDRDRRDPICVERMFNAVEPRTLACLRVGRATRRRNPTSRVFRERSRRAFAS
jgi:hypothetical protein